LAKSRQEQAIDEASQLFVKFIQKHHPGDVKYVLETFLLITKNILENPGNPNYLRILKESKSWKWRVATIEGTPELLNAIGFVEDTDHNAFVWSNMTDIRQSTRILENFTRLINKKN